MTDSVEEVKTAFVSFFQWWWNQPGTNTEQGFDDWAAGPGANMVSALSRRSIANTAEWVRVKPLEWEEDELNWWTAQPPCMIAGGGYEVRITDGSNKVRTRCGREDWFYFDGTADEAKKHWQADYEQRIRSALTSPQAGAVAYIDPDDLAKLKAGESIVFYASDREKLGLPLYLHAPEHNDVREVTPEMLAARDFIADVTARADSLGIGMAKYPTAEIKLLLAALKKAGA